MDASVKRYGVLLLVLGVAFLFLAVTLIQLSFYSSGLLAVFISLPYLICGAYIKYVASALIIFGVMIGVLGWVLLPPLTIHRVFVAITGTAMFGSGLCNLTIFRRVSK